MVETPDFLPTPPTGDRVAARAMVLAAVSCRGLIEKDSHKPKAEEFRKTIRPWLDYIGAGRELEPDEAALLSTPLGQLDKRTALNATWRAEGMVVLAWALGWASLPPIHEECEPSDVAVAMGFLDEQQNTLLHCPCLRDRAEIDRWEGAYLTVHWRLRQWSIEPGPMDFVTFVSACDWGLCLDELEVLDRDLAIGGVRIDKIDHAVYHEALSITQERHQAFNWLSGFEPVYSDVTTDT
jgi:hypothetical protein